MQGFLAIDKPVLGICNGMQMLGCLNGCRMVSDISSHNPAGLSHDNGALVHDVLVEPDSRIASILGSTCFSVNTFHREALVEISSAVTVAARACDGVIEAIDVPAYAFAVGLQWHPERMYARRPGDPDEVPIPDCGSLMPSSRQRRQHDPRLINNHQKMPSNLSREEGK